MAGKGCFDLLACDGTSGARRGRLRTPHGPIETPSFMPVGTQGTVKAVSPDALLGFGYDVVLGNTYHLHARPGDELIADLGGLHRFMGWPRAILTDSGGFQVFSLSKLRKLTDEGVEFQSPYDGRWRFLGPREAMAIQRRLGSDVAMVLDECPPYPCRAVDACRAVDRTLAWAALCAEQPRAAGQQVFGIVQGGVHDALRRRCAGALVEMGFDGYAVGGVSVGEPDALIMHGVSTSVPWLPADRPRYLMGVGWLPQMVEAIALGIDMFDCVMPTRYARNGTALTVRGRFTAKAARHARDPRPLEPGCGCVACRGFSRAYIRHLLNVDEILGVQLLTAHNLHCYAGFMRNLRDALDRGRFGEFRARFHEEWRERLDGEDEAEATQQQGENSV